MKSVITAIGMAAICFSSAMSSAVPAQAAEGKKGEQKVITSEQLAVEIRHNTRYLGSESLNKAKSLLDAYGDFAPFGAALLPGGKVKYVWAVKPGEKTDGINPVLVLNSIRQALKSQADEGRILGSAVIYRFQPEGTEGVNQINVELEYLTGFAQVLGTQYEATSEGYDYGEGAFKAYDPVIFPPSEGG